MNDLLAKLLNKKTELVGQFQMTEIEMIFTVFATFLMASWVYFIYKKTFMGVRYSRSFNVTLVLVAVVVNTLVIAISGNLALSLGMVGALSIVRFRNAIKDPRDIGFLFWSISIGIVNGVQLYKLSLTSSIIIGLLMIATNRMRKKSVKNSFMLLFSFDPSSKVTPEDIENKIGKDVKNLSLTNVFSNSSSLEFYFSARLTSSMIPQIRSITDQLDDFQSLKVLSDSGDLFD